MYRMLCTLTLALCILLSACSSSTSTYSSGRTYKIGIDSSWYPLDIPGREPQLSAFSDELLQEIAQLEKIQITKISISWDKLLWGLQKRKDQTPLYDAILTLMQPQLFLEKQYTFSDTYLQTGPVLVVPADSSLNSLEILGGKEIAISRGSHDALLLEKNPGIIIRIYDSIPEAMNDILKGVLDGALVDVLMAEAYCQDLFAGQLKIATPPLNNEGLRLVTLFGEAEKLTLAFNEGLKKLKESGRYAELSSKWGLKEMMEDERGN